MRIPLAVAAALAAFAALAAAGDDDVYLEGLETLVLESPHLEMTRPDDEWIFIDMAAQRAIAARERPATVAEEFATLRGRIYNPASRALLSIHVNKFSGKPPDAAALESNLRADVGRRKGAELVEIGRLRIGGEETVKVDFLCPVSAERPPGARELPGEPPSNIYFYSRIDCVRPRDGVTVTLFFEVPKERYRKAHPGFVKILKKLKFG